VSARLKLPAAPSELEALLALEIRAKRLPAPVRELRFVPDRDWRLDFSWPDRLLAVEVDGYGRHHSLEGYERDCEKCNAAQQLGWHVYHVTGRMVRDGRAGRLVERLLAEGAIA
jgi:very-short-patch-repair endonuclease